MSLQDIRNYPTYVINLDRRPDRWAEFQKQPTLKEFQRLERFSAVDGSKLDVATDQRISIHTRQNILKKYRRSHYEINTAGAIGASLSHISIWKQFLATDAPYCVVFEDDTLVTKENLDIVELLTPRLPTGGWDMWLLGVHQWAFSGKPLVPEDTKGWWSVEGFTGAHAYVLSRRGAEILLQEPFPIETHIEFYITGCAALKGLRIVRHGALRMSYAAEVKDENDSDTFDSRKSCPVCYVPDNMSEVGFYMPYDRLTRMAVGLTAVGFVGYGWWLARQRQSK